MNMTNLTAKILKAEIAEDGQASITVKLTDNTGFSWYKTYSYFTTQKVKFNDLKKRITEDLEKDLKVADQLGDIKAQVGKEFKITV